MIQRLETLRWHVYTYSASRFLWAVCLCFVGGLHLGLFLVNGNAERVEWLRQRYDSGVEVNLEKEADLASAVSLLRLFLQELPEPVIPAGLQAQIMQLYQGGWGFDAALFCYPTSCPNWLKLLVLPSGMFWRLDRLVIMVASSKHGPCLSHLYISQLTSYGNKYTSLWTFFSFWFACSTFRLQQWGGAGQKHEVLPSAAATGQLQLAPLSVPVSVRCGVSSGGELEHWSSRRRLRARHFPVRCFCNFGYFVLAILLSEDKITLEEQTVIFSSVTLCTGIGPHRTFAVSIVWESSNMIKC